MKEQKRGQRVRKGQGCGREMGKKVMEREVQERQEEGAKRQACVLGGLDWTGPDRTGFPSFPNHIHLLIYSGGQSLMPTHLFYPLVHPILGSY